MFRLATKKDLETLSNEIGSDMLELEVRRIRSGLDFLDRLKALEKKVFPPKKTKKARR